MHDLETLGQTPGFIILSIGAVAFDENEIDELGFYAVVHRPTCEEVFLREEEDTKKWWDRQGEEAQAVLHQSLDPEQSVPLTAALLAFNAYLGRYGGWRDVRLWGNGSDFDNAGMSCAFDATKIKPNWAFWNNRCYRTLKAQAPSIKLVREGTYHNALDDAKSQARHLQEVLRSTNLALN
jgi:exodeoxyribonuclease VIII